ncbi:unnamed protein product [Timema podura]|uniref:Uncharacterized protein n=1 Tax=Timema podura TaxID=61482 RepID=A0ABN7P1J8_TIMPD|nr:unnamed protein product [Timema podura]
MSEAPSVEKEPKTPISTCCKHCCCTKAKKEESTFIQDWTKIPSFNKWMEKIFGTKPESLSEPVIIPRAQSQPEVVPAKSKIFLTDVLWATTRIQEYDDGSKTYQVMKPTREMPDRVPDNFECIFAELNCCKRVERAGTKF